ncbi:MAG: hypothetical protein WBZ37_27820, partial [Mycobacterium sp.]
STPEPGPDRSLASRDDRTPLGFVQGEPVQLAQSWLWKMNVPRAGGLELVGLIEHQSGCLVVK